MSATEPQACDLIVENGYLATLDPERREIASGAVAVKDKRIADIGPAAEVLGRWRARERIDAKGALVHPGFVEAHYHTGLHLTRGVLSDAPAGHGSGGKGGPNIFIQWINGLSDEDEYAGALTSAAEMLRNGYTAFVEAATAFEPDAVASAAEAVGIRCSVSDPFLWDTDGDPMAALIERAPCDRARAERLLGAQVKRRNGSDGLVRAHVALYGMGSATEELMAAAKALSDESGAVYHQHQNFMNADREVDRARFAASPLVHLAETGLLGPNVVFTHMNVLDDAEAEAVVSSGLVVVWHPGNYMYYAVAAPEQNRMPALLKAGVPLGFGTDAAKAWVIGELGFIAYLVSRYGGHYLSVREILEVLTLGGARAFGAADQIGSLEVGKKADLVIRSDDMPDAQPNIDPVYQMMLLSKTKSVDTVIVDGQVVLRGGRLARMDEAAVYAEGAASVKRMMARTGL